MGKGKNKKNKNVVKSVPIIDKKVTDSKKIESQETKINEKKVPNSGTENNISTFLFIISIIFVVCGLVINYYLDHNQLRFTPTIRLAYDTKSFEKLNEASSLDESIDYEDQDWEKGIVENGVDLSNENELVYNNNEEKIGYENIELSDSEETRSENLKEDFHMEEILDRNNNLPSEDLTIEEEDKLELHQKLERIDLKSDDLFEERDGDIPDEYTNTDLIVEEDLTIEEELILEQQKKLTNANLTENFNENLRVEEKLNNNQENLDDHDATAEMKVDHDDKEFKPNEKLFEIDIQDEIGDDEKAKNDDKNETFWEQDAKVSDSEAIDADEFKTKTNLFEDQANNELDDPAEEMFDEVYEKSTKENTQETENERNMEIETSKQAKDQSHLSNEKDVADDTVTNKVFNEDQPVSSSVKTDIFHIPPDKEEVTPASFMGSETINNAFDELNSNEDEQTPSTSVNTETLATNLEQETISTINAKGENNETISVSGVGSGEKSPIVPDEANENDADDTNKSNLSEQGEIMIETGNEENSILSKSEKSMKENDDIDKDFLNSKPDKDFLEATTVDDDTLSIFNDDLPDSTSINENILVNAETNNSKQTIDISYEVPDANITKSEAQGQEESQKPSVDEDLSISLTSEKEVMTPETETFSDEPIPTHLNNIELETNVEEENKPNVGEKSQNKTAELNNIKSFLDLKTPKEEVNKKQTYHVEETRVRVNPKKEKYEMVSLGVEKVVIKPGFGKPPNVGDVMIMHCEGFIDTNPPQKFWSTKELGQKMFTFSVGEKQVIKGWDEAAATMKLKERSKFKIQSKKAYGKFGFEAWGIPPNTDLIFEFEVVDIKRKKRNKKEKRTNFPKF